MKDGLWEEESFAEASDRIAVVQKDREIAELRAELAVERAKNENYSGMSWSGFNIRGDRRSIDEVTRLLAEAGNVKYFRDALQKAYESIEALRIEPEGE